MPINKNALLRQQVIDRCLSSGKKFSSKQLWDECNEALQAIGEEPVRSRNTILSDINTIICEHHAEIIHEGEGRRAYFYYRYPNYSIYKVPLKPEELAQLTQILLMLHKFEGLPKMEWFDETIERFKLMLSIDPEDGQVVGFDENPDLKGLEHFTTLVRAAMQKQPIAVHYRNYKNTEFTATVHPYYIKQFNKRWFLFGYNQEYGSLYNFAIDRILRVEDLQVPYIPNADFDAFEYFDDMIGVTRNIEDEPQDVILRISKGSWPYVATKPLHGTQKVIEHTAEGGAVVRIKVIPNYELEQTILYYGENIEVLAPADLRAKLKERTKRLAALYTEE